MTNVIDVAAYVLEQCGAMTTMKMQKLVFYSQAQALSQYGEPLFSEDFEAWRGGPVCAPLFRQHRKMMIISPGELPTGDCSSLTERDREIISRVCDKLRTMTGNQLSNRTHKEAPWKDARKGLDPYESSNRVITKDVIQEYYSAHPVI